MNANKTIWRFPDGSEQLSRTPFHRSGKEVSTLRLAQEIQRLQDYNAKLEGQNRPLVSANARLSTLAMQDELTGLKNRRTFVENLESEVQRARRYHLPLSVAMLDIDWFKRFNDAYGHIAGDQALQILARLLEQEARSSDIVARYGGEEFALLFPQTDSNAAFVIAERLRARIAAHAWPISGMTVSIGLSTFMGTMANPWKLVEEADQALYHSKHIGRNRVARLADLKVFPGVEASVS